MGKVRDSELGISVGGMKINNLRFADDIGLVHEEQERLQKNTQILQKEGNKAGMKINMKRQKQWCLVRRKLTRNWR